MNPDQGTELRNGKIINSSLETPSPADPDMAQTSSNDSDTNEASDISSQLSEIKENYERKINELQSEFSQLKNLLMAVIGKNDENNLPSSSQSSSKPTHRVGFDTEVYLHYNRRKIDEGLDCFQNWNGVLIKPAKLCSAELPPNLGCIV